jgi:hypothetical protein
MQLTKVPLDLKWHPGKPECHFFILASAEVNPELRWTLWFLESEKPAAVSGPCTNVHKVLKIYLDIMILWCYGIIV